MRRDCLTPPPDDTPAREFYDRFSTFLREAGPAPTRAELDAGYTRPRSPASRYRVRFLVWHMGRPIR